MAKKMCTHCDCTFSANEYAVSIVEMYFLFLSNIGKMKVHGFVNKPIFHFEEAPQPRTKISYKLYEKLFACTSTNENGDII